MARVNGSKRKAKHLVSKIETFKGFRSLKLNPEQRAGNENRIKVLEKQLAEIKG